MKHKKKLSVLLALALGVIPILTSVNQTKSYANENSSLSYAKDKYLASVEFIIGSGHSMYFNSRNALRMHLEKENVKNINSVLSDIFEFIKNGKKGTIKISKSGRVSFTPCSNCPWPSLGNSY